MTRRHNPRAIIGIVRNENPYPIDIFTEPTPEEHQKVQEIFKSAGISQDKIFGWFGRMVWNNCLDKLIEELNEVGIK